MFEEIMIGVFVFSKCRPDLIKNWGFEECFTENEVEDYLKKE